jgi:hypothetical protein
VKSNESVNKEEVEEIMIMPPQNYEEISEELKKDFFFEPTD